MKNRIFAMVLVALIVLLTGCASDVQEAPELLVPVGASLDRTVVTVGDMEDISVYSAAVAPRYTSLYYTQDTIVGEIAKPLGSEVKKGDVLISMDVSSVQRRIGALDAEAAALTEEADYSRQLYDIDMEIYQLNMDKAATEAERYDIETDMLLYDLEYQNAEASRQERLDAIALERTELEGQLSGSTLVSPCDGHVVYIGCSAGQTAGAYDVICVVTDINSPIVQSSFVTAATINNAVEIYAMIGDKQVPLTAEAVDEDDYAVSVLRGGEYLSVFTASDDAGLNIGDSAVVCVVNLRKSGVPKIPLNSLFQDDDIYYVYLIDENETRVRCNVEIGVITATEAEVLSGLEEGDVIYVGD